MVEDELPLVQVRGLASSISNTGDVKTPSYRRVDVHLFSIICSLLRDASKGMNSKQLVVIDTPLPTRPNGNNAAIERELAVLQEQRPQASLQAAS